MTPTKGTLAICTNCKRLAKTCARGLCNACYDKDVKARKIRKCKGCGEMRPHHSHGLCYRCNSKKRYHADPKKWNDAAKKHRIENHDQAIQYDRARNKKPYRKAWQQKRNQEYYAAHKDGIYQYQKKYKETHPGFVSYHTQKYNAKKAGLPNDLTQEQWQDILKQHNYACHYCGTTGVKLQREHKMPVSRGGGFTASNIVPACKSCNMRKHDRTDAEFFDFLEKYPRK